ncbi:hypothetical protein SLEP1_g48833 [Rubroshorea leprosula]|uniref:F-box domain-containing protein n=1 Tax=Rubroshorea leprosula TaxID=152421 RepID=A0AAV5LVP6_9ROSI|nr:hypothetical protein SLEP1_g48833 [Rubroshorea leprosula]
MENERSHYSVRSDYRDEGHWPEGVRSSPKRRKIPVVDRISDLPDSVIHHILSFLPAEDAVKTGVLSKRRMYLWTFAPKLTFRHNPHPLGFSRQSFLSSNGRLEKLVLKDMQNHDDGEHNDVIEILCPNLKSVEILGYCYGKICRLLNVSSLIDVCLTFEYEDYQFDYIDFLKELLEKIKHVKKITLGTWCVEVSPFIGVLYILEFRGLPSPLSGSSCECLTLNTKLIKCHPFGLADLLHCFPTLQKLVIDMTIFYEVKEPPDEFFPGNNLERVDRTFNCLLEHLKTIEITSFIPYQLEPDDLGFVSFLLGNARVLKEVVIHFECKGSEFDLGEKAKLFDLTQKLLSFPRCSPHAVVLID